MNTLRTGTTATNIAGRCGVKILTAAEIRSAEANIAAHLPEHALIERAATAATRAIAAFTGRMSTLVLCGPGNSGADGHAVATRLAKAGWPVRVAALDEPSTPAARVMRARWDGKVEALASTVPAPLLVDALFGIGLTRALAPEVADRLAELAASARVRIALDVPSGVDANGGALLGARVGFDLTVAFGALKPAHVLQPAASLCGRVVVADIGLSAADARLCLNKPPAPPAFGAWAHKAQRGHVIVLGGGHAQGGAARLSARAALRCGAGLVTLVVPTDALAENAARLDAVMLRALDDAGGLGALLGGRRVDALALGPGLGTDGRARALVEAVLATDRPLVLDADVFTLFQGDPDALIRHAPTVLTPHEGEFARLFGDLPGSKVDRARAGAERTGAVLLLKGADTVIAHPDGLAAINPSAAPWLATAGSGDTLTGVIAARLGGGEDAFTAACAGAWLHARAGERAGPGMTADDLPELLGDALRALASGTGAGDMHPR